MKSAGERPPADPHQEVHREKETQRKRKQPIVLGGDEPMTVSGRLTAPDGERGGHRGASSETGRESRFSY
jgi:hypothetical protein